MVLAVTGDPLLPSSVNSSSSLSLSSLRAGCGFWRLLISKLLHRSIWLLAPPTSCNQALQYIPSIVYSN